MTSHVVEQAFISHDRGAAHISLRNSDFASNDADLLVPYQLADIYCVSVDASIDRGCACSDLRHPPWGGADFVFTLNEGCLFRAKQPPTFTA
ncbi:hypothetical protein [Candidatus Puniceispirillum marinum]|uniref:Cytochrome C family protein n=1 Tax=Puniceispirillum marinum (strain IMCC1322) TaxID=488538 RepID=D5BUH6_PUNMI|nr:hypothetical protein [Candidatus Puniceispirillum marinum]ADE39923.1 cytochrome C family protein [Candidatus Puniceispirillum marinum IMCC1322]